MLTLENKKLLVRLSEGRGARIESFVDKETHKEWVWKPETLPAGAEEDVDLSAGFDEHWAGGWEEVFPNDAPAMILNHHLVDHGELWRRSWVIESKDEQEVVFSFNCETYPMRVEKRIRLHESLPRLQIDYEIMGRSPETLPFIFKFHPALKIEPGDRFNIPESKLGPVALGFSRIIGQEEMTPFPFGLDKVGQKVRIDEAKENDGYTREFVRASLERRGECELYNSRTRKKLILRFPQETLPYVWLFQSYGGFMGHYVSMLEPTNAGHYDLELASTAEKCGFLRPFEKKTIQLCLELSDV
jgi:galactose mutarotase-like enzyme